MPSAGRGGWFPHGGPAAPPAALAPGGVAALGSGRWLPRGSRQPGGQGLQAAPRAAQAAGPAQVRTGCAVRTSRCGVRVEGRAEGVVTRVRVETAQGGDRDTAIPSATPTPTDYRKPRRTFGRWVEWAAIRESLPHRTGLPDEHLRTCSSAFIWMLAIGSEWCLAPGR